MGNLRGARQLGLVLLLLASGCAHQDAPAETGAEASSPADSLGKGDSASRTDWVLAEIDRWNASLDPADRALKLERLAASPFSFFRGTNHLYWADLGADPRLANFGGESTVTWLQGDLHAANFGAFHDDDGRVVYDLNDFDESVLGDYQLDVWRMATSIVLLGLENRLREDDLEEGVDAFTEAYLDTLHDLRGNGDERGLSFTARNTYGPLDNFLEEVEEEKSRRRMLARWTLEDGGRPAFDLTLDKLGPVSWEQWEALEVALPVYGRTLSGGLDWDPDYFAIKDIARRLLAGTGSLGTPRYYVLIEGPTRDDDDDIILDVKRQGMPTALAVLGGWSRTVWPVVFGSEAERVVLAQRALLTDVDDHLGWLTLADGSYSVRERSPYKEAFPLEALSDADDLVELSEQWGAILAVGHARADRDFDDGLIRWSFEREVDELTDGQHREVRALVWEIAQTYARQVHLDYESFVAHGE